MPAIAPHTPIIIGVGQASAGVPDDLEAAPSAVDLAAAAARRALEDAGGMHLASQIDTIAAVRTFADSSPTWQSPFGSTNNFPRSVGLRIGAQPERAIYDCVGGDSPQKLVAEFAEKLAQGTCELVLLTGGEAIANTKAATKAGVTLNWSETVAGQLEDRGISAGRLITQTEFIHQLVLPMQYYGLMENARRADLQQDLATYTAAMGRCLSPFSEVAAGNPYAVDQQVYTAETLATPAVKNPLIVAPYTKLLMAKDRVNQGAAVLMTTVGKATEWGIPPGNWVYLHGYANVSDRVLLERPQLGHSTAMQQSLLGALANAEKTAKDIRHFDIYSCFPIVVSEARTILDIPEDDPRPLTQTGGLPFFGGPGNNYTMHGIAALVETLRLDRGSFGLVYANGGWMFKHAAGIYSTTPPPQEWQPQDSQPWQAIVDRDSPFGIDPQPQGEAILETYTAHYFQSFPVKVIIAGRLTHNNQRFYATTPMSDTETAQAVAQGDQLGATIYVEADPKGNRFAFSPDHLARYRPVPVRTFKEKYNFCTVQRSGWILTVTINRPEVRNALSPPANEELEGVFNAYEADDSLRVAILTGAGSDSFSAGNDLKYMAAGNPIWVPQTGFAGITSRVNRVKPIIAAVNGSALGGGLEIAMATDIIVAADHAIFGLPEVKIGLFAGAGGVQRLTRQIGRKAAMEMLLTGQPITCEQALARGLINYAVPADQLLDKADALAQLIAQASPVAIRSTLELLNATSHLASTDEAVTLSHTIFDNLLNSDDFFEGARAFAEKRPPKWTRQQD